MIRYILKRLLAGVISMVVLITVVFFMMHAIPGDPFAPSDQKNVPPEILERIRSTYGLDKPVIEQYFDYWKALLQGNLGVSVRGTEGVSVSDKITHHFPSSLLVGGIAVVFSLLVGIPLGVLAAIRRKKAADFATMAICSVGISIPSFVLALLLLLLAGEVLKIPISVFQIDFIHLLIPVLCLSFNPIAYIARQTRSSMLEALENDYVRTARAKGVGEIMVVAKHALKNALTPVITYLGPLVAGLLTGSFVVEKVFSIDGIGRYFVQMVSDRDYNMIMGIVIFYGAFVVICNLVSDILLAVVDPRVRYEK